MKDQGSFRDPSGGVYNLDGRILRTVEQHGLSAYQAVRDSQIVKKLQVEGRLIRAEEIERKTHPNIGSEQTALLLEHPVIPYVSYPYEWSFSQLKNAALCHLDIQLDLLSDNIVLSDATAYNIQFIASKPIFIDTLSLRPYRKGEYWSAHRQFCQQFLNPLVLSSVVGIPFNEWYRGSLEGIQTEHLAAVLPKSSMLSWNILTHVFLQSKISADATATPEKSVSRARSQKPLSKLAYSGLLKQLRNWISKLKPYKKKASVWGNYSQDNTYSSSEASAKEQFISEFITDIKPKTVIDLGCNSGDYSVCAIDAGAKYVVGFDFDHNAVATAYNRASESSLNFLPLWLDAANPSPGQGWLEAERQGFGVRFKADGLLALAFEHHLVIGKNIPMEQAVEWLVARAPVGVIEFVPKNDETVRRMLAMREDIFPDYSLDSFINEILQHARVVRQSVVSESGRVLIHYDRLS